MPKGTEATIFSTVESDAYVWGQQGGKFGRWPNSLIGGGTSQSTNQTISTTTGLSFPATQVPSADPNTLDDYEEGTWTPTIKINGATVANMTYDSANTYGFYTKIGNCVFIDGRITLTSTGTGTGSIVDIYGLPFQLKSALGSVEFCLRTNSVTIVGQAFGQLAATQTYIRLIAQNNGVGSQFDQASTGSNVNYLTNTSSIRFSFHYIV